MDSVEGLGLRLWFQVPTAARRAALKVFPELIPQATAIPEGCPVGG